MSKVREIPIIGSIIQFFSKVRRWIDNIFHLNKRFYELSEENNQFRIKIDELQSEISELKQSACNFDSWNRDRMREIIVLQEKTKWIPTCSSNVEFYEDFGFHIKTAVEVWGDRNRLHISELATLPGCLFNVNSGEIFVGDYSFSGSNVSLLAGSHNYHFEGLMRRDTEQKKGCNIHIGNGVWLGSNCTVLGPATIGDNAVIAAGAVVTPGTIVGEGEIYAGIPAKKIHYVDILNSKEIKSHWKNIAFLYGDLIFGDGWNEYHEEIASGERMLGHTLIQKEGFIYTSRDRIYIRCPFATDGGINIQVLCNEKIIFDRKIFSDPVELGLDSIDQDEMKIVKIVQQEQLSKLFFSIK